MKSDEDAPSLQDKDNTEESPVSMAKILWTSHEKYASQLRHVLDNGTRRLKSIRSTGKLHDWRESRNEKKSHHFVKNKIERVWRSEWNITHVTWTYSVNMRGENLFSTHVRRRIDFRKKQSGKDPQFQRIYDVRKDQEEVLREATDYSAGFPRYLKAETFPKTIDLPHVEGNVDHYYC